jgi:uncharacterized membrane protein YqjE
MNSNDDMSPPFLDRGKSMLDQLMSFAQTRLELLSVEIQREKLALAQQLKLMIAAAVCGWLAGLALILWVALSLPPDLRSKFLAGLFIVLLAGSIVSVVMLRRRAVREPIFSRVIQQLRLDRAALGAGHESESPG